MKKTVKAIFIIILIFVVFPASAGFAVMALWNTIMPALCGFALITYWQSVGLFLMGQILTGGILLALLFVGGGLHAISHHHGEWGSHWHSMTDEERRKFIERRRRGHFGFHNRQSNRENAAG